MSMPSIMPQVMVKTFALSILALSSPIMLVLKAFYSVFLCQPLFTMRRCLGRSGLEFTLIKFNTLYHLYPDSRFFKWIRAAGIDEIPQLWNVYLGDMNLIGSRPETVEHYLTHPHNSYKRLSSKPGLTGLWQISNGRGGNLKQSWRLDQFYQARKSFRLDLHIVFKTFLKMSADSREISEASGVKTGPLYIHHLEATEGGTLKYLEYLSRIESTCVKFHFFQRGKKPIPWAAGDSRVRIIPCSGILPIRFVQCLFHSLAYFDSARPTFVHAHSTISGMICRLLRPVFGFHVLYTPHCFAFTYPHRVPGVKSALRFIEGWLSKTPFTGIHVSDSEAVVHREMNPNAPILVIPSPAADNLKPIVPGICGKSRIILVVGSPRTQKGYGILDGVQAELDRKGTGFKILVLGGGRSTSRIRYERWQKDVHLYYGLSFCLLNVSFSEGCSLGILDAMHSGLPVIGMDIPPNREVLAGRGILIRQRDPKAIVAAIQRLAGEPDRYEFIHRQSRHFALQRHGMAGFLMRFLKLYRDLGIPCQVRGAAWAVGKVRLGKAVS